MATPYHVRLAVSQYGEQFRIELFTEDLGDTEGDLLTELPPSTLMEPSGFQGHGARGGRQTGAEHDTTSGRSSIPPEVAARPPEALVSASAYGWGAQA